MAQKPLKILNPSQGSFNGRMGKLIRSTRKSRAPVAGFVFFEKQSSSQKPLKMFNFLSKVFSAFTSVIVGIFTVEVPVQTPVVSVSPTAEIRQLNSPAPLASSKLTSSPKIALPTATPKTTPNIGPSTPILEATQIFIPMPTPIIIYVVPSATPTPTPDSSGTLTLGPVDDTNRALLIKSANMFGLPAKYQSKDGSEIKIKSMAFEMYLSPNGPVLASGGTQLEIFHPSSGKTFSQNLTTFASVATDNNGAQRGTFKAIFKDPIIVTKGTIDNINFSLQNFAGNFTPGVFVELTIKSVEIESNGATSISGLPKRITFTYQGGVN